MKTMLFNPYTGTPRHPSDISSDPEGILLLDPDEPVGAAPTAVDHKPLFGEMIAQHPGLREEIAAEQHYEEQPDGTMLPDGPEPDERDAGLCKLRDQATSLLRQSSGQPGITDRLRVVIAALDREIDAARASKGKP